MSKRLVSVVPTIDQMLSSATAPLFLLSGYIVLPTESFALTAQFIFLYGCLASICQAMLGEPYLISCKKDFRFINSSEYTSASIVLAAGVSLSSFPLMFLITGSFELSGLLLIPVLAMLLQDSKRIWRISNKSWKYLVGSDAFWLLASFIAVLSVKQSAGFFLFLAWGIPGCIALLIIIDYSDLRHLNLINGWRLLVNYSRNYYYTVVETIVSGVSMVIAYWAIAHYLGEEEIAQLRYATLLFGLSTVVINRQRVFDYANERRDQLKATSRFKAFRRMREISRVVAFNLFILWIIVFAFGPVSIHSQALYPGIFLLFAIACDRLSVGLLMSVTVFYKTHLDPKAIAKIRTWVSFVCALIYAFLAILDFEVAIVIILGTIPNLTAFGVIFRSLNKSLI